MVKGDGIKLATYQRATALIKGRFKKIQTQVESILSSADTSPLTQVQIRSLTSYLTEIERKRQDFELNFNRVLENASDEDISEATLSQDQDEISDLYILIVSQIESHLPADDPNTPGVVSNTSFHSMHSAPQHVRLPQLDLKTFDGDVSQWVSYINLYDATVHQNASLSSVIKMQYLLSSLSGEPQNLVQSLNISAANYPIAYQLLRDRYHNTRRLSTLHLNAILDLPNVYEGNIRALRQFINLFTEHTQALSALQCDITAQSNPFLSAHLLRKLDQELRRKLEIFRAQQDCEPHSLPTVEHIVKFLNEECIHTEDASLHSPQCSNSKPNFSKQKAVRFSEQKPQSSNRQFSFVSTSDNNSGPSRPPSHSISCFACQMSGHKIYTCTLFLSKTPQERSKIVKSNNRCYSCLGAHTMDKCISKNLCITCHKKHHTLLHFEKKADSAPTQPTTHTPQESQQMHSVVTSAQSDIPSSHISQFTVILGTALVKLTTPQGNAHVFRALLDSGSQLSFISEHAAQLLNAPRVNATHNIVGISATTSKTKGLINLDLTSLSDKHIASHHPFHILNRISADLPRTRLVPQMWTLTRPYVLADPTFHLPGTVDVLIGGDLYPRLLTQQSYALGPNLPHMVGTHLGYVVMGPAPCEVVTSPTSYFVTLHSTSEHQDLHTVLQRFWQQEEPPASSRKSMEEQLCDEHFATTHRRTSDGRYSVKLPFKPDPPLLGFSRQAAEKRFLSLERKFLSQPELKRLYCDSMANCEMSGHMTKLDSLDLATPHSYLPHHGVLKSAGSSAKLRVVYDASCKTSSGISLNDTLMTGPKLQTDICDILLHFRTHKVVFTCDIRQMYLQIAVQPPDNLFQLVLWRKSPTDPLNTYSLDRVTFGVSSSPYLAIRTIHQLAEDEGHAFPTAASVLKTRTYVDDILAGADTLEAAKHLQNELIQLLSKGQFELRKWSSNVPDLLQGLPEDHRETPVFLKQSQQPHVTVLGLHWSPVSDSFKYNLNLPAGPLTKRNILSLIARIYDPCGFLSPLTMLTKCFMQLLWSMGLQWDEPLRPDLATKWQTIVSDIPALANIEIPRTLQLSSDAHVELHGFSDASESGYAAAVYMRCQNPSDDVTIRLILAKTRVAPLKRVTLPRLELCGAHLLAQLVTYCISLFKDTISLNQCHLWCDSSVALTWLQTPSYRLKTYVANRVAQTQEMIPSHCWHYIPSKDNPADSASRGILASELVSHSLWWTGPTWLSQAPSLWPNTVFKPADLEASGEVKSTPLTVLVSTSTPEWDLLSRFSSWTKLQRVMAYILRLLYNLRHREKRLGVLSSSELQEAALCLYSLVQRAAFAEDLSLLGKGSVCSTRLQRLAPFLDAKGLIRVGGRLSKATIPYETKHAIVLPKSHPIVDLFIDHIHKKHLHAGSQLTQAILRETVWILSSRSAIRSRILKCIVCFKHNPRNQPPLMGDLPTARVNPSRPFLTTGIDFGGPFMAKAHTLRAAKHVKVYICVMICLASKAVHIEMVTDLTTEAFIAALTRFVSRRGLCADIYSDCGTNFVGANTVLKTIIKNLKSAQVDILNFTSPLGINFHFNPPAAPHQGGLWEAAIKSAKHHLRRVIGEQVLSFAEFTTLINQVEAMLNSRPLTALSNDPADFAVLTPGHFLIGSSLSAVPERSMLDVPASRLKAWQLVQSMHQHIWKRWQREYLHTLQQRGKWISPAINLKPGDLVLVNQPTPPLTWPLGRVINVYPGKDGVVRVVKIQTQNSTMLRPSVKVCPLPSN